MKTINTKHSVAKPILINDLSLAQIQFANDLVKKPNIKEKDIFIREKLINENREKRYGNNKVKKNKKNRK